MRITGIITILVSLIAGALFAQTASIPGELPRWSRSGGTIFRCLFDRRSDARDGDLWPDDWTRKSGIDQGISFPAYLDIGIVDNRNPFGGFALRMNMQGGGAAVFSPKIRVRRNMSYTVSAYVDAENVVFDDVSILMAFYGEKTTAPIRTELSEKVKNTGGWRRLEIGPFVADAPDVEFVAVGLLVIPGKRQDFGATIDFTNVEIRESPTVDLSMSGEHHLFFDHRDIDVQCRLQGIDPRQHTVDFLLEDPFGRVIGRREVEMMIGSKPASQFVIKENDPMDVFLGSAVWNDLPIISPGFYRLRVSTPDSFVQKLQLPEGVFFDDPLRDAPPLTFVVMEPGVFAPDGEFGWSLDGWSLDDIVRRQSLLSQSALSVLKIPAWLPENATDVQRRQLEELCDRLAGRQVRMVGLLRPVPAEVQSLVRFGPVNAAALFSLDVATWSEPLQPLLQTLSLLVKDWQWTSDDDTSIAEIPGFVGHFEKLRREFDRNDYDFGVGFAWDWNLELPERFSSPLDLPAAEPQTPEPQAAEPQTPQTPQTPEPTATEAAETIARMTRPANEFVSLTGSESLTPEELADYLQRTEASQVRRFVSITPLDRNGYSLENRVDDLVRRMVVGKVAGAEALILTRPIDGNTGVLRSDATPGELYLPWRTTSRLLSGKPYLGSVFLPGGSRNHVFDDRGGRAVMVLWNDRGTRDRPVLEVLHLGPEPEIVDVWGRRVVPEQQGRDQVIPVTSVPVFVTGLDTNIVRHRLGFQLQSRAIAGYPNRSYKLPFTMKNDTAFPVSAQISAVGPQPDHWTVLPPVQTLALEPGAAGSGTFDIRLSNLANTGRRPIRVDIKIDGAEPREFSVYDELNIGETDAFMEFSSRINRDGDLEVTQAFVNNGDKEYTYTCRLRVPGRAFQTSRIVRQGFGRIEHVYTIRNARELIDAGVTEMSLWAEPVAEGRSMVGQPMVYTIPISSD